MGELTVADGGPRSATIAALSDLTVLRLPREAVLAVADHSPTLTRALLASLASTVRRLTGDAADLVFLDVPGGWPSCCSACHVWTATSSAPA